MIIKTEFDSHRSFQNAVPDEIEVVLTRNELAAILKIAYYVGGSGPRLEFGKMRDLAFATFGITYDSLNEYMLGWDVVGSVNFNRVASKALRSNF